MIGNGDDPSSIAVVAAGGIDELNSLSRTVETLLVTKGSYTLVFAQHWEFGQDLPMPMKDVASATTANKQSLFLIGGTTPSGESSFVFRFDCSAVINFDQCFWIKVDHELMTPSTLGLVLTLPRIPMVPRSFSSSTGCDEGDQDIEYGTK